MYQSLIWTFIGARILRDEARSLRAPLDAKDLQRLADTLVDGVRRDVELGSDFLRREEPIDEPEAVKLATCQAANAFGHRVARAAMRKITGRTLRSA